MSDSTSRLPARPSLEQLSKQAKELLRQYRAGDTAALDRFSAAEPRSGGSEPSLGATLGDAATEHIASLKKLKNYYAGHTRITDRSLEILGRMPSLERLEFWECAALTEAGIAHLAGLPNLRELTLDGLPGVTKNVLAVIPAHVRVNFRLNFSG